MKKQIVIIGGGFAGIATAKSLANKNFNITIIDRKNHHLFQPLLYQVASAALSPADISVPIREVVSKAKNIKVVLDEVVAIDKEGKFVQGLSKNKYSYDYLIVATGSRPFYFGNDHWEKIAPGLKSLEDALSIRNKVLNSFEECERNGASELNFVIIGAGPTGVELAGAFAEIAYKILLSDYQNFDSKKAKVYLVEGGREVLPSFSGELSKMAKNYLEELGVIVITGERVEKIEKDSIHIGDREIKSNNIIWAAGNKASPLIDQLEIEQDRMGRAIVEDNLSLRNYPEIFILGDSAHFKEQNGTVLPSLAPVASQQGKHVAKQLIKKKSLPFKYLDKGSMATIGNFKAVMNFHGVKIHGALAWLSWCFIHILFLIDFRNRFMVFTQWAFMFIFNKKGVRIITDRESTQSKILKQE